MTSVQRQVLFAAHTVFCAVHMTAQAGCCGVTHSIRAANPLGMVEATLMSGSIAGRACGERQSIRGVDSKGM